jgi:hypothetical protein
MYDFYAIYMKHEFCTKLGRPQGCQMAYFQTKIPILGKYWRVQQWKIIGIVYGH